MKRVKPLWSIRYRDGRWQLYDRDVWSCTFDSLPEAHTLATQNAVADVLYRPGGLTWVAQLLALEGQKQRSYW